MYTSVVLSVQTLDMVSGQYEATYQEAEAHCNASKNRFPDKLPSECVFFFRLTQCVHNPPNSRKIIKPFTVQIFVISYPHTARGCVCICFTQSIYHTVTVNVIATTTVCVHDPQVCCVSSSWRIVNMQLSLQYLKRFGTQKKTKATILGYSVRSASSTYFFHHVQLHM